MQRGHRSRPAPPPPAGNRRRRPSSLRTGRPFLGATRAAPSCCRLRSCQRPRPFPRRRRPRSRHSRRRTWRRRQYNSRRCRTRRRPSPTSGLRFGGRPTPRRRRARSRRWPLPARSWRRRAALMPRGTLRGWLPLRVGAWRCPWNNCRGERRNACPSVGAI
jgi:hypothetical protein